MKKILVLSFLLVSMMALFVSSTSAQMGDIGDMMGDTCFGLSEADCAVINSASENMLTVTSFGQTFTLNVQMSGIQSPDMPTDVSLQASGTGPVMMVMVEETMTPNFNLPLTATFNGTTSDVSVHLVDGIIYLGTPDRTVGFAIEDLGDMGDMLGGMGGMGDTTDMPEMPEVPGMPDLGGLGDLGGMGGMLGGMMGSLPIGDYISYTRLPDADVNGMSLSPFYFNADISGLLQSPEISGLLSFIGPMLQGMGGGNSEIEIPAETMAILEALPALLESLVVQLDVTQYVGQDNFIHKLTFNANLNVDMSAIATIMPEATVDMPTGVVSVVINFDVELSGINQPVTVTAPEGAEILTEEQLKEFFEQFGPLGGMLGQ